MKRASMDFHRTKPGFPDFLKVWKIAGFPISRPPLGAGSRRPGRLVMPPLEARKARAQELIAT